MLNIQKWEAVLTSAPNLSYCHVQTGRCYKVLSTDLTKTDNGHHQNQPERKLAILNDNTPLCFPLHPSITYLPPPINWKIAKVFPRDRKSKRSRSRMTHLWLQISNKKHFTRIGPYTCIPQACEFSAFIKSSVLAGEMSPRSTILRCSLGGTGNTFQVLSRTSAFCGWKNGSSPESFRCSFLMVRYLSICRIKGKNYVNGKLNSSLVLIYIYILCSDTKKINDVLLPWKGFLTWIPLTHFPLKIPVWFIFSINNFDI